MAIVDEEKLHKLLARAIAGRAQKQIRTILDDKLKEIAVDYLQQYYDDYDPKVYVDTGESRVFMSKRDMKKSGWSRKKISDYEDYPHRTYNFLRNSFYVSHSRAYRELNRGNILYDYTSLIFSAERMRNVYKTRSSFGVRPTPLGQAATESIFYDNFYKGYHGRRWAKKGETAQPIKGNTGFVPGKQKQLEDYVYNKLLSGSNGTKIKKELKDAIQQQFNAVMYNNIENIFVDAFKKARIPMKQ